MYRWYGVSLSLHYLLLCYIYYLLLLCALITITTCATTTTTTPPSSLYSCWWRVVLPFAIGCGGLYNQTNTHGLWFRLVSLVPSGHVGYLLAWLVVCLGGCVSGWLGCWGVVLSRYCSSL
eukprot:GHVQ01021121.1.p2 GENE.GHVQ01021121.1~~GHVQ01021121.1.p2  ORF type:complete len:120 (+),score=16.08 GHVQ01021121.1:300-659(+)